MIFWLKARAGLGNRLLALAAGLDYARRANREIYVDWSDNTYSQDRINIFQDIFEIRGIPCLTERPDYGIKSVYPACWRGHLDRSVVDLLQENPDIARQYDTSIEFDDAARKEEITVGWSYDARWGTLSKYYPDTPRTRVLRAIFTKHLQLVPSVKRDVLSRIRDYGISDCVGVHYRQSDKKSSTPLVDMLSLVPDDSPVFLCTDNKSVIDHAIDILGPSRLRFFSKWMPDSFAQKPGESSLHQNKACPDRLVSLKEAILDMWCLASCKSLIRTDSSTFSYISELVRVKRFDELVRLP